MARGSGLNPDFENVRLITSILTLYYRKGLSQAEIAQKLGLSTSRVNRLFAYAHEQGMVEIKIHTPLLRTMDIEARLQAIFGIREAVVVPAVLDDTESLTEAVGAAGAHYIETHIHEGDTVVSGGGTTLLATVRSLETRAVRDVTVVPLEGGLQGNVVTDVNYVVSEMAQRLGARGLSLHAPAFVDSAEQAAMLKELSEIKRVMDTARHATVAAFGIGQCNIEAARFALFTGLSADDMRRIRDECGGIGEIGSMIFDIKGRPTAAEYTSRVVGLTLPELKRIPLTIGLAATAAKALPIYGALRGGYLDVLVTDELAAQAVLDLFNQEFHSDDAGAESAGQPVRA